MSAGSNAVGELIALRRNKGDGREWKEIEIKRVVDNGRNRGIERMVESGWKIDIESEKYNKNRGWYRG